MVDGVGFGSLIAIGPVGDPSFSAEVGDVVTGEIYMSANQISNLRKINKDMKPAFHWGYDDFAGDYEFQKEVEGIIKAQFIASKAIVNDIYWNVIGKYGHDLSVFGL